MSPQQSRGPRLDLSPRAKRAVMLVLAVAIVVIPLSYWIGRANAAEGFGNEPHSAHSVG